MPPATLFLMVTYTCTDECREHTIRVNTTAVITSHSVASTSAAAPPANASCEQLAASCGAGNASAAGKDAGVMRTPVT
jgi:hypothetical protein